MPKANVFLSYRREDSEAETRNIRVALEQGGHKVFMDRTGIQAGERWPDEIRNALKNANIVIVVIGEKWLTCSYTDGRRRIDGEEDWVRLEIKTALQTNKTIIPILINRATMPSAQSLPEDLKELSNWQALTWTGYSWENDIKNLLQTISETVGNTSPKPKPTFLLTSQSPRRKELLGQIGWEEGVDYFTLYASVNLNPDYGSELKLSDAKRIAERTARRKISWVMENSTEISKILGNNWNSSNTILIGVDTIVFCKKKILDRPLLMAPHLAGPEELEEAQKLAKEMLMDQRGQQIYIITSLAVAKANDYRRPIIETVVTEAQLRNYSEEDVDNYISASEPFDKAGAFGIQEKGISLFNKITGSYTNVVGLPLQEFISLINLNFGKEFALPEVKSSLIADRIYHEPNLSVACVGDINYDYIYDKFPENFFSGLQPPGTKFNGPIRRGVGGTAVNFAKGARKVGFSPCYVVGIIGRDGLGSEIEKELDDYDITPISTADPNHKTSIAIILRDMAKRDTSITITDAHQSLPDFLVGLATDTIKKSDVFYCSGYCLIDRNRYPSAVKMMQIAKNARQIVVLDIAVGMNKYVSWNELKRAIRNDKNHKLVDVVISELPEIFAWLDIDMQDLPEMDVWERYQGILIQKLREEFQVAILRTSTYTHEIVVTSDEVIGPVQLDYGSLSASAKVGYGDFRTAKQMHSFLSPRIVLASKSPQRFDLLSQIVAPSKIQVVVSNSSEDKKAYEKPYDRVTRLALEKAEKVFLEGKYHDDIELILAADTEIIRQREDGEWDMIGHPHNAEEAIRDLTNLNGKSHFAITGIAIIGRDPQTHTLKKVTDFVETRVTFGDLSFEQIKAYAETGEPLARAGAYAIQGLGTMLIKDLDGSYSNVVGLPLERLCEILAEQFNKPIWLFDKVSNWTFPLPIKDMLPS